jgi:hypothetical protein
LQTNFEQMTEDIQAALDKPNPNVKIQTDLFLYRVFKAFNQHTMPKKMLKTLAPAIIKAGGDCGDEWGVVAHARFRPGSAGRGVCRIGRRDEGDRGQRDGRDLRRSPRGQVENGEGRLTFGDSRMKKSLDP